MRCPKCGHGDTRVIDSRMQESTNAIKRRRECRSCGYRFTTFERCEDPIEVLKSDGTTQPFDRNKLMVGLMRATSKRDIELPSYAYEGDAGLDLRANESVDIPPFSRVLIPTGLAIALPDGFAGFVQPRSGMALKRGLTIANTPGLIDAHYRGELKVIAVNIDPHETIHIERGERIAQLVIQQVPVVRLIEVDELDETDRGCGGFGSSGSK